MRDEESGIYPHLPPIPRGGITHRMTWLEFARQAWGDRFDFDKPHLGWIPPRRPLSLIRYVWLYAHIFDLWPGASLWHRLLAIFAPQSYKKQVCSIHHPDGFWNSNVPSCCNRSTVQ